MRLQSGNQGKKKKKNNGGFTTIEQIVVIILVLILASGLVIGIMKWVEWTQFKRQNEYAQTLFVAAQNQLTEFSQSGTLPDLQDAVVAGYELDQKSSGNLQAGDVVLKGRDGEPYDLDKVWPQSAGKGKQNDYRGSIYSIIGTPDDYKQYAKDHNAGEGKEDITAMYDLLSPYVYDTSIFANGTVCVELAPEDGQVFAVLYSDKSSGFQYAPSDNRRENVDISNRKTNYRKKRMVGYYGVEMLSKSTSAHGGKPVISGVHLNNEDTLNLTFRLSQVKQAVKELTYEIDIYDQTKNRRVLELTLDGSAIGQKEQEKLTRSKKPLCSVTRYNYDDAGKVETQDLGDYQILAWIEKDEKNPADGLIRVILDGADLAATAKTYDQAYDELMATGSGQRKAVKSTGLEELQSSYSFRRFGVLTEDIYCTVKGTSKYYKPSAKKKSNTENTYFGSMKSAEEGKTENLTYTIENARHLYNIRYLEDYGDDKKYQSNGKAAALKTEEQVTYQLAADVDWTKFVDGGALYDAGEETAKDTEGFYPEFPSIRQLRSSSVMKGSEGKSYAIRGLRITRGANKAADVYTDSKGNVPKDADQATGLFITNEGTLKNLKLDQITVSGGGKDSNKDFIGDKVGAFCGINEGTLTELETADSDPGSRRSTVTGENYVGGIFGFEKKEKEAQFEGLVNRAKVTGNQYVGGIVGYLEGNGGHIITVENCKNYGVIAAGGNSEDGDSFIGGITGYIKANNNKKDVVTLRSCTASPQYTEAEIKAILENPDAHFVGKYVGGIVGYNDYGTIRNCNTKKESRNKEGYVIGDQYVGGIVGYSNGADVTGTDADGGNGVNAVHVLGKQYVGGIAGINEKKSVVSGWTNKGVVAAKGLEATDKVLDGQAGYAGREAYAGGITGYNDAKIEGCTSEVDNNSAAQALTERTDLFGDYAGGIAGFNKGEITSKEPVSVRCNVIGKNYIGGIAGYNDVSGTIQNYKVSGGYVKASGCFAGGYAGLNRSPALVSEGYLSSNPNEVIGTYCVGGTFGGNIIVSDQKAAAVFQTDNFLGALEARAFAGGFIGYNKIVPTSSAEDISKKVTTYVKEFNGNEDLKTAVARIGQLDTSIASSKEGFVIFGKTGSASQSHMGSLTAELYVGGVVGYNAEGTPLVIQDVTNRTPVTAKSSITNEEEQPNRRTYDGKEFSYSYAGGIIGKVSKDVWLMNCRNQDVGDVVTQGTYLGGLCEINEGTIQNCAASSIGNSGHDYVGGIAGVSKSGGRIEGCTLSGKTITGRNYVGGIASENFGSITGTTFNMTKIRAFGTHEDGAAGGITARNYKDGQITTSSSAATITVDSDGPNVGGITGVNEGNLANDSGIKTVIGASNITGDQNVGGVVGSNRSGILNGFYNEASVTARAGNAGGIAGVSNANVGSSENDGDISAPKSGNAGGIVGNNSNNIMMCRNYGNVSAQNGICGGITGVNEAKAMIRGCTVSGKSDINLLTFKGKQKAGGVSGVNNGTISTTKVYNLRLINLADSKNSVLGGIAGENTGTVRGCTVGEEKSHVIVKSWAGDVAAGGVAGTNAGTIREWEDNVTSVYADLSFISTDPAYYGNLGGIAGSNAGSIRKYAFNGTVAGTGNNPQLTPQYDPNTDYETNGAVIYGYGGIAGVNEASITDCKVNTAKITGLGDVNNIANVGGVAGVNAAGAAISGIQFGTESVYEVRNSSSSKEISGAKASVYVGDGAASKSSAANLATEDSYTHAGGVAGLNSGSINKVNPLDLKDSGDTPQKDASRVIVEGFRGHVGGIVGYNRRMGAIDQVSTGDKWVVFAPQSAQDNGCGGIVGYSASEKDMTDCYNRAYVHKTAQGSNGVGGIIGRLECATSSSWTVKNCANYGAVSGADRVGGIIGVWKYYGGTISNCRNYARISGNNQGNGGIAGMLYQVNMTSANFMRCENHGKITGAQSAGIIGGVNGATGDVKIQLQRCVNTGLIEKAGTNGGGIVGKLDRAAGSITGCNNYGYQSLPSGQSKLNGIMGATNQKITVTGCFGIADTVNPLTNDSKGENYYVGYGDTQKDSYSGIKASVSKYGMGGYQLEAEDKPVGLPGFSINPTDMNVEEATSDESLAVQGDAKDNIRYKTFQADNEYFIASADSGVTPEMLGKPDITAEIKNGAYQAKWTSVEHATFYQYTLTYMDGEEGQGNVLYTADGTVYDTSITSPVTAIDGKSVKSIILEVTAGAETMSKGQFTTVLSKETAKSIINVADILPIPQYHLELMRAKNNNQNLVYAAVLDNTDDYEAFLRAEGVPEDKIQEGLDKIQIHIGTVGSQNDQYFFTAADGSSRNYDRRYNRNSDYAGNNSNKTYYAYAESTDSKLAVSSPRVMRESMAFTSGTYTGAADIAAVNMVQGSGANSQVGFQGVTADTLKYRMTMKAIGDKIFYMRSELMAVDQSIGVPVAVSTSQLRTSDVTKDPLPTYLSSLPADLLNTESYDKLMVRSYPFMMSNNVVYTGHTVDLQTVKPADEVGGIGVSKDVLKELYVTDDHQVTDTDTTNSLKKLISEENGAKKLAPGFVIELAADGTYTLYYNALLEYNREYDYSGGQNTCTQKTQVFYYWLKNYLDGKRRQPEPVVHINEEDGKDGDPNADQMVVTWDLEKKGYESKEDDSKYNYAKDAVYDYVITGYTADETAVQIAAGSYQTGEDGQNELELDTTAWNYKKVIISVSRRGEEKDSMTTVFPTGTKVERDLKLRFTQITAPDIALHKDDKGYVWKNSLLYDLTWPNIPQEEQKEMKAYEIRVTCDENNFTKTWLVPWTDDDIQDLGTAPTTRRTLDLNDFGRGDAIEVSVRALAKDGSASYRDGAAGVVRKMELPSRLDVPEVAGLKGSPLYHEHGASDLGENEKDYMTLEEYQKQGLELSIAPANEAGVIQGNYELAIAVYDTLPAEAGSDTGKIANVGDGDGQQEGYWNAGAVDTVIRKDSNTAMDGDLKASSIALEELSKHDPSAAYAGKWLKIAMRTVSENNISSLWSDEDDTADQTVNYQWIQIPRVQLEVPQLSQGTKELFYGEDGAWKGDPSQIIRGEKEDQTTQTALSFGLTDNADSYQIQLIRSKEKLSDNTAQEDSSIQDVDWIYAQKAGEGSYDIFYASSDPTFDESPYWQPGVNIPVSVIDDTAVYLGRMEGDGGFVSLPYTKPAAVGPEDDAFKVNAVSYIQLVSMSDGKMGITMVLPDTEKVDGYQNSSNLFTNQASVQAKVTGENPDSYQYSARYEDSGVCDWYRSNADMAEVIMMSDYQKAPDNIGQISITGSNRDGTAYEISAPARNRLVYQAEIYDSTGTYKKEYVSAYGAGTETSDIITLALLPTEYGAYAGKNFRIRVAAIADGRKTTADPLGGLSQWTKWIEMGVLLPVRNPVPTELEEPAESAELAETYTESMPEAAAGVQPVQPNAPAKGQQQTGDTQDKESQEKDKQEKGVLQ